MKMPSFATLLATATVAALLVNALTVGAGRLRQLPGAPPGGASPVVQIVITGVVLAAALWVLLSKKYPAEHHKWAFGVIGTILGYWLG